DHNVKLIVVACNTASAVALDYLQQRLKTPVVGVIESGAAAALAVTKNKRVGVIGTEGTIKSGVYEKALKTLNPTLTCFSQATGLFVPVIEEGIFGESILQPLFTHYLANFLHKDIDTLILGCTHYPILKKQLGQFLGSGITLVDSAQTTARQVWELLNKNNLLNTQSQSTPDEIFFSDAPERVQNIARKILNNQGLVIKQGGIN
ncbi:MAG TPA: glutamate racemase, partial [bacterium]|nr:glutamate racemase [bacterium]